MGKLLTILLFTFSIKSASLLEYFSCSPGNYRCENNTAYLHCTYLDGKLLIQAGRFSCPPETVCVENLTEPCHALNNSGNTTREIVYDVLKNIPKSGNLQGYFKKLHKDFEFNYQNEVPDYDKKLPHYPIKNLSWRPQPAGFKAKCRESGFFIGTSCDSFYVCYKSQWTNSLVKMMWIRCPTGKHFNPFKQLCIPKSNSGCID